MKKIISTIFSAFLLNACFLNAQTVDWAFPIVPTSSENYIQDELSTVCIDNNDNLFVVTTIYGQYDLDTTEAESLIGEVENERPVLCKFSPDGTLLWSKILLSEPNFYHYVSDAECDAEGNIYITGYFEDNIDFDPGEAEFFLYAKDEEMFILKLNSDGEFIWAKQYGGSSDGSSAWTNANVLKLTSSNIYVAGDFRGNVQFDAADDETIYESNGSAEDIFVLKLSLDGTLEWCYTAGGPKMDVATAIDVDADGNAYVAGTFSGDDVNFGKDGYLNEISSHGGEGSDDVFIIKVNEQLTTTGTRTVDYAKAIGGMGAETCYSILVDDENKVYFSGMFTERADFNPFERSEFILETTQNYDSYITELSENGGFVNAVKGGWHESSDDERFWGNKGIFKNGDKLYVLEGNTPRIYNSSDLSIDFNPIIEGKGIEMAVGSDGAIYVLGKFEESMDMYLDRTFTNGIEFNPGTSENLVLYKITPKATTNPTAISDVSLNNMLKVYPNPVSDKLFFSETKNISKITIYNALGAEMETITQFRGNSIEMNKLKQGLYFVNVSFADNSNRIVKVIKQ